MSRSGPILEGVRIRLCGPVAEGLPGLSRRPRGFGLNCPSKNGVTCVDELQREGTGGMSTTIAEDRLVLTVFSCDAPLASEVCLVGAFNDWDSRATPMRQNTRGVWTTTVELAPGSYEYKFVVDGQWRCQPGVHGVLHGLPGYVHNHCGTLNRVIHVGCEEVSRPSQPEKDLL